MKHRVPIGLQKGNGIEGVLGGIRSIAHLASLLSSHFLPASMARAPGARGSSGGRTVVHTTESAPSTTIPLTPQSGGSVLIWTFPTPFPEPPVVNFSPAGAPPSSGTTLFIVEGTPTNQSVQIQSTSAADARLVHLSASLPS